MEKAKHWVAFRFFQDDNHSSLLFYKTLQPEYKYADYLSAVKCYSNRRLTLLSRFRSGCHGLRVDTGRCGNNVHKKDRLCLVCKSSQHVEDEHHFLIASVQSYYSQTSKCFSTNFSCVNVFARCEQMHVVVSLGAVFSRMSNID